MQTLRAIKSVLVCGVLAIGCGSIGVSELSDRFSYAEPVTTTCAEGLGGREWVTLSGCEAVIVDAVATQMGRSKTIVSVKVPIRAVGTDDAPTLRLDTSDPHVLAGVRNALALEARAGRPSAEAVQRALQPVPIAPFQAHLVEGVLHQTDAGQPGLLWPLVMLLMAAVWALAALGALTSMARGEAASEPA